MNAIGLKVEVEHMLATGRIDLIAQTSRYIYVIELKLRNNGGKKAAIQQILDSRYLEPFKADKRKVIGLGIELDEEGKACWIGESLNNKNYRIKKWSNNKVR